MTTFLDRLLGRPEPPKRYAKAVTSLGPWGNGIPLSSMMQDPQQKAAVYLRAYKVGWFYKAGRKIAGDISTLDWSVSDGDIEEGEAETTLSRPDLREPFESLSPIDQFQRLLERPNPNQTGRQLMHKTEVRLDFAGAAAWYLEGASSGLPTAIYGISPARMWPSYDKNGNLLGWVMDKDAPSGGVPFDKREILWFSTGNADDNDIWGTSVVEAVYSQVPLTDMMARHTANVLTTGGRLAGMLWPKDRALNEDEFTDAQRAWRNVASDPDAGKRLLIFPEPMEYAQGASTPQEIGIPELAVLNRDEILTAFPLSPYQLGVPMPGGLNSAETRREDRRDYWEGTIHPRADLLEEAIQVGLLSVYEEASGQTFDFEIDEPNLDDAPTLLEKAAAYRSLVAIGFDAKDLVKAVGLDHIEWSGLPDQLDPAKQAAQAAAQPQAGDGLSVTVGDTTRRDQPNTQQTLVAKATKARETVASYGHGVMRDFFDKQRDRIVGAIRVALPPSKAERMKADLDWWDEDQENSALQNALRLLYLRSTQGSLQVVADALNRIVPNKAVDRIMADLLTYGAERIVDINAKTLQAITLELAEGARRGYSINQLIDGVPDEGFRGVLNVGLDNGIGAWDDARAETIARTETALSYNRAALDGYKEFRVSQVVAHDGDHDYECAVRNGGTFDIDDALSISDHPNGTLDWSPVVDKGYHEASEQPTIIQNFISGSDGMKALDLPAPVINLPAPVVNIEAPVVNVAPPDLSNLKIDVPTPVVVVDNVRVTSLPDRTHTVTRDKRGLPTGSVETDA